MALPSSGAISISNCSVELGWAANAQNDLNNSTMRSLANVPSGAIGLANFYGKSWLMRWSGSTVVATYYGIEASGSSWRVPGGGWLTTYHDTFQAGSSYYSAAGAGLQASGNAIRNYRLSVYSSTWIYWSAASGFTGSATVEWQVATTSFIWKLETSGGSVRSVQGPYFGPTYGPYVYLY